MGDLSPKSVSKKVYKMLTIDSQPPAFAPEWRGKASSYLSTCLKLFSVQEKRRRHVESFQEVCNAIGSNNYVPTLIGFSILFVEKEADYFQKIRNYLCYSLKNKFYDPCNVITTESRNSKIDEVLDSFVDPISVTPTEVKAIVEYVRNLRNTGRNRIQDLRQLARVWATNSRSGNNFSEIDGVIRQFEGYIESCEELVDVFFDLLYMLDDEERCLNSFVTGFIYVTVKDLLNKCQEGIDYRSLYSTARAHYNFLEQFTKEFTEKIYPSNLEKVLSLFRTNVLLRIHESRKVQSSISLEERLAYVGQALFYECKNRKSAIDALVETLEKGIRVFSRERWIQALLDACISEGSPQKVASVYFFNLIHQALISDDLNDVELDFLTTKCGDKDFFHQDNMNMLVGKVSEWTITKGLNKDFSTCIQRALCLSKVYKDTHPCRKLLKEFSQYKLQQNTDRFKSWFIKITFRLLRGSTYRDESETRSCQNEIKEFLSEDTVKFKGNVGKNAEQNMNVVRKILHVLSWEESHAQRSVKNKKAGEHNFIDGVCAKCGCSERAVNYFEWKCNV